MLVYQRVYIYKIQPYLDDRLILTIPAYPSGFQTVTTGITSHVLKHAYYTHVPDACVMELDDGKILTGKPYI